MAKIKHRIRFFVNLQKVRIDKTGQPSRLYAAKIRELKNEMGQVAKRSN